MLLDQRLVDNSCIVGHARERSQEPAVSKRSLADVPCLVPAVQRCATRWREMESQGRSQLEPQTKQEPKIQSEPQTKQGTKQEPDEMRRREIGWRDGAARDRVARDGACATSMAPSTTHGVLLSLSSKSMSLNTSYARFHSSCHTKLLRGKQRHRAKRRTDCKETNFASLPSQKHTEAHKHLFVDSE